MQKCGAEVRCRSTCRAEETLQREATCACRSPSSLLSAASAAAAVSSWNSASLGAKPRRRMACGGRRAGMVGGRMGARGWAGGSGQFNRVCWARQARRLWHCHAMPGYAICRWRAPAKPWTQQPRAHMVGQNSLPACLQAAAGCRRLRHCEPHHLIDSQRLAQLPVLPERLNQRPEGGAVGAQPRGAPHLHSAGQGRGGGQAGQLGCACRRTGAGNGAPRAPPHHTSPHLSPEPQSSPTHPAPTMRRKSAPHSSTNPEAPQALTRLVIST